MTTLRGAPLGCEALRFSGLLELLRSLPLEIQRIADRAFIVLKINPRHPSLRFKKVNDYWSVRVGSHYRALGVEERDGVQWFWIGSHEDYNDLV